MKTETKKEATTISNETRGITVNPELNKYQDKILFPKKLALAEEQLKGVDFSVIKKHGDESKAHLNYKRK